MNMKTLNVLSVIAAGAALSLYSCTGPAGQPGPMGPQGPQGNANVIMTPYTILSWSANSSVYYANLADNNLNSSILSNGSTEVFMSLDAGNSWEALPLTASPDFMGYITSLNQVQVFWASNVNLTPPNYPDPNNYFAATLQIKIVDIAPYAMKQHPNTNWKDWSQVNAILETQKISNQ
jgi:hypothetical protein